MSLADSLAADLDGLSDGEGLSDNEASGPTTTAAASSSDAGPSVPARATASSSSGSASVPSFGSMLPPPVPMKAMKSIQGRKRLADALDAVNGSSNGDEDDPDTNMDNDDGEKLEDGSSAVGFVPVGGVRPADELDMDEVEQTDMTGVEDVGKVAKLVASKKLKEVIQEIDYYSENPTDMSSATGGLLSESTEYNLVVTANNMSVEVDNEILLVHKFIRDHYAPRFPELEQLIGEPWTYIAAVNAIGNADDITKQTLPSTLPAATILSITLTATGTRGRKLTPGEWTTVQRAIEAANQLRDAREKIFAYVESRMADVAPNLSLIVGTGIAAKLLGLAGGLQALSRTPSCNVMLFGALKKSLATSQFSAASQQRHTGFIFQSSLVQGAQPEDRRKAQRAVSNKVVLAARIDAGRGYRDGSFGKKTQAELHKKIEKMAEPPPNKMTKALPIPQETSRKKRGGKKARKDKEAYAQTELRKLQNRMEFGKAEEEADMDDETVGLGMIGSATGRVRGEVADSRSKAKLSRANKIRTQLLGRSLSADAKSGTSTSLSFTPVQGIEIVTPSLAASAKVQAANERWFASGTFTHVKKEGSSLPGQGR